MAKRNKDDDDNIINNAITITATVANTISNVVTLGLLNPNLSEKSESPRK